MDRNQQELGEGLDAYQAPPSLPAVQAPQRSYQGQIWMIAFTDLVALMLAFFVMLFAMSKVEWRHWENMAESLAMNLNVVREVTTPVPSKVLDIESVNLAPGVDLGYLAAVLRHQMDAEEILAASIMRQAGNRLIISLPGNQLFAPASTELAPEGERVVFAMGGILRHLKNRIEVVGHVDPRRPGGGFPSNWELSLARAVKVAVMLARAGYQGDVRARGTGDSRYEHLSPKLSPESRSALARRIDVVILDHAGEDG